MRKNYYLETHGCQMNEHDSERMAGLLDVAGYTRVATAEEADVAILNTCAIRENADNKLYGHLGALKTIKAKTGLKIAVGGCQAEKDRDSVRTKAPWVDVVFGTRNFDKLPGLLARVEEAGVPIVEFAEQFETFPSALPTRRESGFHAWIAIQYGCNNACTFCIVPSVRGREVSRSLGDVYGEVRRLVDEGVTEFSLLGQNVNSYGRDLAGRPLFAELLRGIDEIDGVRRVRYTSPHPKDFKLDTAEAMRDCASVCEHLHFPLQSGSDNVLKAMKRAYSRSTYLDKVAMARETVPGIAITTDIIVGFPGETEDDFEQTIDVVNEVGYDSAYMFQFSPRPGTPAMHMDPLAKPVVQARFDRLVEAQTAWSQRRNNQAVGTVVELTMEKPGTGRTRTNKLVHLETDVPAGVQMQAKVTDAKAHYLLGVPA